MEKKEELMKAFTDSIEMEEEGREFYLQAAKECRNELGKKVFEALADDETRHIVAIKGYCEAISKKNKAPQLCQVMPRHKTIQERLIFGKRESEILKNFIINADDMAAEVPERQAWDVAEEEAHYELISSTYKYLKDPASWFAEHEKPIVEG